MKVRYINSLMLLFLLALGGCGETFLDVLPEDKITSAVFWTTENDVDLALNGVYAVLRETDMYSGTSVIFDSFTPDAHRWGSGIDNLIGRGEIHAGSGGFITGRWTSCYKMISRANYFLENIERVESLSEEAKRRYRGEAHFLRGVAYALLAETYGRVPIITKVISVEEARQLTQATVKETWQQAIADYDVAIQLLGKEAPQVGRATKGAALGMKMRAYLYQNDYPNVLTVVDEIEALGLYSLFPSYEGLFLRENENNQEVLFDVQYIGGPIGQGATRMSYILPGFHRATGAWAVPTDYLVEAYEMIDGSEVDPSNPFEGRDPRLGFTVTLPGTYIGPLLFNTEAIPHPSQPIKHLAYRKYTDVLVDDRWPIEGQEDLNFIVIRYADVILAKAEALIETGLDISGGIELINRIRTERNDVKMFTHPLSLTKEEARKALRHERRIEFALEGIYRWADIKRWEIGPELYPLPIYGTNGALVETRYASGYQLPKDRYLPIPNQELSMNPNLTQNPGW